VYIVKDSLRSEKTNEYLYNKTVWYCVAFIRWIPVRHDQLAQVHCPSQDLRDLYETEKV